VQGSSLDASSIVLGDFTNVTVGLLGGFRHDTSENSKDADFARRVVTLRVWTRCDIAIMRRAAFAIIKGVIPAE
jgi:hypothetical protein